MPSTWNFVFFAVVVSSAGIAVGLMGSIAIAEWARWTNEPLAVPALERAFAFGACYALWAVLFISCLIGIASLIRRRAPKVLLYFVPLAWIVAVASLSALFLFVPTLNAMYDRYRGVIRHATTWAPRFTEARFDEVRAGATESDLLAAVGEPLDRVRRNGSELWVYSEIGNYRDLREKGFHQRAVIVKRGRVVKVIRRYLTSEDVPF